jgi:peptidoglycan/LPS O-acetylase OafA/YrhL
LLIASDSRSVALDGVRGCAAISVVIYHGINICDLTIPTRVILPELSKVPGQDWPGRLVLCIFDGGAAVHIFFILSGLVLSASLQREPVFDAWAAARFVIRRILRLYPALIFTVLAFGLASHLSLPAFFGARPSPTLIAETASRPLISGPESCRISFGGEYAI